MTSILHPSKRARTLRRIFRRSPWESAATAIIALGVAMLCQPWLLAAYTYSFLTVLTGTILFVFVTKLPD